MTQTPDMRPQFWLHAARKDQDGNWNPVSLEEVKNVKKGLIRLKEVPELPMFGIGGVVIPGMTEVHTAPTVPNTFKVNYSSGRINFHSFNEGQQLTLRYKGIGSLVATDEINYLYEQTLKAGSFISLADTADTLIPNAYLRVDQFGKIINSDAATVGRATSVAHFHDFEAAPEMQLPGAPFDIITLFEPVDPSREVKQYTLEAVGDGIVDNGVWKIAAGSTGTAVFSAIDLRDISKLFNITAAFSRGAGLRFVVLIEGVYYTVSPSELVYVGITQPVDILGIGNDVSELLNLSDIQLAKFAGKTVHFVFEGSDGAELSCTWDIDGSFGGGWRVVTPDTAKYSMAARVWTITSPSPKVCLVTMGSGHDDVMCNADTFEFKDVNPNQTISVHAPVRTLVNVLYAENNFGTQHKNWPISWTTRRDAASVIRVPGEYYGACRDDYGLLDFNPIPTSAVSLKSGTPTNTISGGYPIIFTGTKELSLGTFGPSLMLKCSATRNDKLQMCANPGSIGSYNTNNKFAISGWFKYVSGTPIILTSGDTAYVGTNTARMLRFWYTNATTIRISTGVTYVEHTVPADSWVYIAIDGVRATVGTQGWPYLGLSYRINDDYFSRNIALTVEGGLDPAWTRMAPTVIGNAYWASMKTEGVFLVDSPMAWTSALVATQSDVIYDKQKQDRTALYVEEYETYSAENTFFDDGVSSLVDEELSDATKHAEHDKYVKYYFTQSNRIYIFDEYNKLVELASPSDYVLFNRGMSYAKLVGHYNTFGSREQVKNMTLNAICEINGDKVPGMLFEFKAYQEDTRIWSLVKEGIDANVTYNEMTNSWLVTSKKSATLDFQIAVLGGTNPSNVRPIMLSDLLDGTSLTDTIPKTLVSLDGRMQKRPYLHPYLLGG